MAETATTEYHLVRDRSRIPEEYKWRLEDIYPTDSAWRQEKASLIQALPSIGGFRGKLASSPDVLFECLDTVSRLSKQFVRLYCYTSMKSDLDTRDSVYAGMEQEISQVGAEFSSVSSFIQPEIIAGFTPETIEAFLKQEPRLADYRHELFDLMRRKEHTGTEGEERILAESGLMADGPSSVYNTFADADFPFPDMVQADGTTLKLDKPSFSLQRASFNREDRKQAFALFFGKINEFRRTFGAQLAAQIKKDYFYMKARRYNSCLEKALDGGNIPTDVYRSLITGVNENLPTFHRYLSLRKRILGVDQLHYYDLYCPLVRDLDLRYTYEEATERILASLSPLGEHYCSVARTALSDRWVDVYPNDGKRSGAYSNGGVYDVHPYMLLNFNGKYDDMSTLTHELGHTMHSYLSNKNQPYPTAHYSIFVAEVASTFNEALLMDFMLKNAPNDDVRLSLLGNELDAIRGTVFRQTQFSEFELMIHEKVEKGESLTGDGLNEMYRDLTRKYYGHDGGVCVVDDVMQSEWAYIPHFYYNFYVYQYATSYTASVDLSGKVLGGDEDTRKRYLELLSSGGSDYPVNLLKRAGVDLTTRGPFDRTMDKMNRIMDEMEAILERS
ncbi:MAG: oligoendopeptidase F [Ignavibacteria bacterium]|nr:oligoendopeptidase F [Ignavibacteria bacterium]